MRYDVDEFTETESRETLWDILSILGDHQGEGLDDAGVAYFPIHETWTESYEKRGTLLHGLRAGPHPLGNSVHGVAAVPYGDDGQPSDKNAAREALARFLSEVTEWAAQAGE